MSRASTAPSGPRANRILVVVVAAVMGIILVAILYLTVVADQGTDPIGGATDPPSPSASLAAFTSPTASAMASADPTAEPSASPEASAPMASPSVDRATALGIPPGLLPAGSMATVTAEAVRVRSDPSTDSDVLTTMSAGDAFYVDDVIRGGPIAAVGFDWYPVQYAGGVDVWPWMDLAPDGLVRGWVAAGNESERFAELAEVACPAEPPTLEVLAFDLTPWERLVCLSGTTITIDAADFCNQEGFGGCGGTTPGAQPTWLADVTQHRPMVTPGNHLYPFINVAIPPELQSAYDDVPAGRVLRITVHVDDPAAATCVLSGEPDDTGRTADPDAVGVWCRERLVLESFEDVGENDLGVEG